MQGYLIVTGILFALVGLRALINPVAAVAVPYGLAADGVDAKNYLRSGAGGVTLACAGVLIAGGLVASLSFAALVVAVTVLGGLLAGRAFSLLADGSPGLVPCVSAIFETIGLVLGGFWLFSISA